MMKTIRKPGTIIIWTIIVILCAVDSTNAKNISKRLDEKKSDSRKTTTVDYPTLTSIPTTPFSCQGLKGGYYADFATNCQVFHICDNGRKISFLCPNGTIFQQSQLICDWWFKTECHDTLGLYKLVTEQYSHENDNDISPKWENTEVYTLSTENVIKSSAADRNYKSNRGSNINPTTEAYSEQNSYSKYNANQNDNRHIRTKNRHSSYKPTNNTNASKPYKHTYTQLQRRKNIDKNVIDDKSIDNKIPLAQLVNNSTNKSPVYTESTSFRRNPGNSNEFQELAESGSFYSTGDQLSNTETRNYHGNNLHNQYVTVPARRRQKPQENHNSNRGITPSVKFSQRFYAAKTNKPKGFSLIAPTTEPNDSRIVSDTSTVSTLNTSELPFSVSTTENYLETNNSPGPIYQKSVTSLLETRINRMNFTNPTKSDDTTSTSSAPFDYHRTRSTTDMLTSTIHDNPHFLQTTTENSSTQTHSDKKIGPKTAEKLINVVRNDVNSSNLTNSAIHSANKNAEPKLTAAKTVIINHLLNRLTKNMSLPLKKIMNVSLTTLINKRFHADKPNNRTNQDTKSVSESRIETKKVTVPAPHHLVDSEPKNVSTIKQSNLDNSSAKNRFHMNQRFSPAKKTSATKNKLSDSLIPLYLYSLGVYINEFTKDKNVTDKLSNEQLKNYENRLNNSSFHADNKFGHAQRSNVTNIHDKKMNLDIFPSNILTKHALNSYADLFNINNADNKFNMTILPELVEDGDELDVTMEDDDLDYQQSRGPVEGIKKLNNDAKLRQIAKVFSNALSVYFENPELLKQALVSVRPMETMGVTEKNFEINTRSSDEINTERYEEQSVDYFDDSVDPSSTPLPLENSTSDFLKNTLNGFSDGVTGDDFIVGDGNLLEGGTTKDGNFLEHDTMENGNLEAKVSSEKDFMTSVLPNFSSKSSGNDFHEDDGRKENDSDDKTDVTLMNDSGFDRNEDVSDKTKDVSHENIGIHGKTGDVSYENIDFHGKTGDVSHENIDVHKKTDDVLYKNFNIRQKTNKIPHKNIDVRHKNDAIRNFSIKNQTQNPSTPQNLKTNAISASGTTEPFTIRYYEPSSTPPIPKKFNLLTNMKNKNLSEYDPVIEYYISLENNKLNDKTVSNIDNNFSVLNDSFLMDEHMNNNSSDFEDTYSSEMFPFTMNTDHGTNGDNGELNIDDHWTSSPTVTQLWESTVFVSPNQINDGLTSEIPRSQSTPMQIHQQQQRNTPSYTKFLLDSTPKDDELTSKMFTNEPNQVQVSTPWKPNANYDDAPTAFSLLPTRKFNSSKSITQMLPYTTRSSIITTLSTSISSTNFLPATMIVNLSIQRNNTNDNDDNEGNFLDDEAIIQRMATMDAHEFTRYVKQAHSNSTMKQFILFLINHCNMTIDKSGEQEKEYILQALSKLPKIGDLSSEEFERLVNGIKKITLPFRHVRIQNERNVTDVVETDEFEQPDEVDKRVDDDVDIDIDIVHGKDPVRSRVYEIIKNKSFHNGNKRKQVSDLRASALLDSLYTVAG